jgi:NAD(P)-dependent dehydrogenase (short-subunit alcohol dehydrogenase family)
MPSRLQGRRILITGAASGIGQRTAELFAAEGAALTLLDCDRKRLASVARETGGTAVEADVTQEPSVMRAVEQGATAMGGIDGVVNAAGIVIHGSVLDVGLADWKLVLDVNLTGTYIVVRCCLPWLAKAPFATIVNIASGQGLLPNNPGMTAYAASKGGVVTLTRALAAELAPSIRVNSVCPGMVDTPMTAGLERDLDRYALGRIAEPLEIAQAILFLTSTESSFVTGAALAIDGGRTFH